MSSVVDLLEFRPGTMFYDTAGYQQYAWLIVHIDRVERKMTLLRTSQDDNKIIFLYHSGLVSAKERIFIDYNP